MAERNSWAVSTAGGLISTEDARIAIGGAFMNSGALASDARSGWLPSASNISAGQVTATGTPNAFVNVAPFMRVQQSTRGKGPYIWCLDTSKAINVLSTPADPTNQRNDLIIAQQSDAFYGDAANTMLVKQVVGTPSGSPVDPTVTGSADYILLARVRVTAAAATITTGMIDDLRPTALTVGNGGVLPIASAAARSAISLPYVGMTIFRTDRNWHEVMDSSFNWRIVGVASVTNFSDLATFITGPYNGQLAYVSVAKGLYRYLSGVWQFILFTETGGGYARYRQSTLQAVAAATDTKVQFQTAVDSATQVTPSGTGNIDFTLNLAGVWSITATARLASNASANERLLALAKSSDIGGTRYAQSNVGIANASANLSVSINRRFAAGDSVSAVIWQNTGGSVNTDPSFAENMHISFNWEGN